MVTSFAIDADWSTDVPTIVVGSAYAPVPCQVSYTAGANQIALVKFQVSAQFDAADVLLLGAAVDDGTGLAFAVTQAELAGTGTLDIANVSASARIPLTAGANYVFAPGIYAGHLAGLDLNVLLGTCHGTVSIVTEGTGTPLAAAQYSPTAINPLTGATATLPSTRP